MTLTPIQVLVVDPYPVVKAGVRYFLEDADNIQIVGEVCSVQEAIKFTRQHDVNVILCELNSGTRSSLDFIKQLKKEFPQVRILVFSNKREDQYALRSLKSGASGFLNKDCSAPEMIHAIRQVYDGQKYITTQLAQDLANNLHNDNPEEPHKMLSDREFQTMILIASGKSVTDIAKDLSLSVKTISEYRSRILAKMNLRHNAEITHYAIQNQLVE